MIVGIGSGSTVVYAVDRIAERVQKEGLKIKCIPTSFQSEQLIIKHGLVLTSLAFEELIDVTIDGADEIDSDLNLIKGGGACHVQEKLVAFNSSKLVIIADYRKVSNRLGVAWTKGVPVEVISSALHPVQRKIRAMGGNPVLRMGGSAKAGPVVTDNGNLLVDAIFGAIEDARKLHLQLVTIPGVVDSGIFVGMAEKAYIGMEDGSVKTYENMKNKPAHELI
jgi:ribose 5-phosphate isomerase A